MKRFIVLFILLLAVGYSYSQKISGGFVVSPIVSWMKPSITKQVETDGVRLGFAYGLTGDLNLSDNFAFSTSFMVNNFGGAVTYLDSVPEFTVNQGTLDSVYAFAPNATITHKLQYIEIPLSLKGKTNEIGYMTYFMKAGISPMFKWQAKGDVTQGNIKGESIKSEVASFVLGFNVGGGFEYSLGGNTKLLVEFIYTNGLTDITNTKFMHSDESNSTEKIILNSIQIKAGILF